MLYIALSHYPVYNKEGRIVTTAIANMDIHDIARCARTYDVKSFYIVNPHEAQRSLAEKIISHWREGYGASFNPLRQEAFGRIRLAASLEEVRTDLEKAHRHSPATVVTSAGFSGPCLTCRQMRERLERNDLPYLLIFGTGSGIAREVVNQADYRLEPIRGAGGYNHLAVRSAVAVILDRIAGI